MPITATPLTDSIVSMRAGKPTILGIDWDGTWRICLPRGSRYLRRSFRVPHESGLRRFAVQVSSLKALRSPVDHPVSHHPVDHRSRQMVLEEDLGNRPDDGI